MARQFKRADIYAVLAGGLQGQFLIGVDKNRTDFIFMSIPQFEVVNVPKDEFEFGLIEGIIDYVETMKPKLFKDCKKKYKEIKK